MAQYYSPEMLSKLSRQKEISEDEKLKSLGFVKVSDGLWRGPYQRMGIRVKA